MRIRTLALYLIGYRQAILTLAADRRALWVGFLFVLSANFMGDRLRDVMDPQLRGSI